jgi:hypothetical protein
MVRRRRRRVAVAAVVVLSVVNDMPAVHSEALIK